MRSEVGSDGYKSTKIVNPVKLWPRIYACIGKIACFEMKMVGKPYVAELQVQFDKGEEHFVS
jgi:hypothetical protein